MATHLERREFWQKVVREFTESGLSQAAFAAQRGVSRKSLQRWRGKLRDEFGRSRSPAMVEVVVAEPLVTAPAPTPDLELLVGGDCSLFFAPGTAPDYVADLVVALRERGAC